MGPPPTNRYARDLDLVGTRIKVAQLRCSNETAPARSQRQRPGVSASADPMAG
jgi:hypothetical protein